MNPTEKRKLRTAIARALRSLPEKPYSSIDGDLLLSSALYDARAGLKKAFRRLQPEFYDVTFSAGPRDIRVRVFEDGSWKALRKGIWRESIIQLILDGSYPPDAKRPAYVNELFISIREGR